MNLTSIFKPFRMRQQVQTNIPVPMQDKPAPTPNRGGGMQTVTLQEIQTGQINIADLVPKMDIIKNEDTKGYLAGWTSNGEPIIVYYNEGENRKQLYQRIDELKQQNGLVKFKELPSEVQNKFKPGSGNINVTTPAAQPLQDMPTMNDANTPAFPAPVAAVPAAPAVNMAPPATMAPPTAPAAPVGVPNGQAQPIPTTNALAPAPAPVAPAAPAAAAPKKRAGRKELHAVVAQPQLGGAGAPTVQFIVQQGVQHADGTIVRDNVAQVDMDLTQVHMSCVTQLLSNALSLLCQQKTRTMEPQERVDKLGELYNKLVAGDLTVFDKKTRAAGAKGPRQSKAFPVEVQAISLATGYPLLVVKGKWESYNDDQKSRIMASPEIQQALATVQNTTATNTTALDQLAG